MRTATDTYTGKRFRYNEVTWWPSRSLYAPTRIGKRTTVELHPDRTDAATLARLNPASIRGGPGYDADTEAAKIAARMAAGPRRF